MKIYLLICATIFVIVAVFGLLVPMLISTSDDLAVIAGFGVLGATPIGLFFIIRQIYRRCGPYLETHNPKEKS